MTRKRADWQAIEDELIRRGKSAGWLAQRLGYKNPQTVYNWKYRGGAPIEALPRLAEVLGPEWSVERLLGGAVTKVAPDTQAMTPMARALAIAFDKISDEAAQLAAYSHCIAVIARACDGPPEPPTGQPGPQPSPKPPRNH